MSAKHYVVTIAGKIAVDTTFAVIAESEEEAARLVLEGACYDTKEWLHQEHLIDNPVVTDVSQESREELEYADHKHLVGPLLHQ